MEKTFKKIRCRKGAWEKEGREGKNKDSKKWIQNNIANLKPKMDPWEPIQKKLLLYVNHHEKGMWEPECSSVVRPRFSLVREHRKIPGVCAQEHIG